MLALSRIVFWKSFCTRIQYLRTHSADCMSWLMPWQIIFVFHVAETDVIVQALCSLFSFFSWGFAGWSRPTRNGRLLLIREQLRGTGLLSHSVIQLEAECPSRFISYMVTLSNQSCRTRRYAQNTEILCPYYWFLQQHSSFHTASAHHQNVHTYTHLFVVRLEDYAYALSFLTVQCFLCF
jgi:hypothetical protein